MYLHRVPYMACIKMAWHELPRWHILILAVTGFFFLSTLIWPLGALGRVWRRRFGATRLALYTTPTIGVIGRKPGDTA